MQFSDVPQTSIIIWNKQTEKLPLTSSPIDFQTKSIRKIFRNLFFQRNDHPTFLYSNFTQQDISRDTTKILLAMFLENIPTLKFEKIQSAGIFANRSRADNTALGLLINLGNSRKFINDAMFGPIVREFR